MIIYEGYFNDHQLDSDDIITDIELNSSNNQPIDYEFSLVIEKNSIQYIQYNKDGKKYSSIINKLNIVFSQSDIIKEYKNNSTDNNIEFVYNLEDDYSLNQLYKFGVTIQKLFTHFFIEKVILSNKTNSFVIYNPKTANHSDKKRVNGYDYFNAIIFATHNHSKDFINCIKDIDTLFDDSKRRCSQPSEYSYASGEFRDENTKFIQYNIIKLFRKSDYDSYQFYAPSTNLYTLDINDINDIKNGETDVDEETEYVYNEYIKYTRNNKVLKETTDLHNNSCKYIWNWIPDKVFNITDTKGFVTPCFIRVDTIETK